MELFHRHISRSALSALAVADGGAFPSTFIAAGMRDGVGLEGATEGGAGGGANRVCRDRQKMR